MSNDGKSKRKVLIIGIDGGTFDVISPMVKDNKLPNLASIMNKGTYGELLSTIPPVTAPAWSSFITGTNPGKHGIFGFFKQDFNNYNLRDIKTLMSLSHMKGIPFWRVLNNKGLKVGLINIPLTYPPDKVQGFMISGMLVPPNATDYVYPAELFPELDNYSVDLDGLMDQNKWQINKLIKQDRGKFIESVFSLSRTRAENAIKLMKKEEWDLFTVVFTGSDRICHFFWEDPESGEAPSSIVKDYYIFLDSLIGKLIDQSGENTIKIVISDHGFGKAPTKGINVDVLMKQLGHTVFARGSNCSYIIKRLSEKIGLNSKYSPENSLDWKCTRIFPVPIYSNLLGICINTKNEKKWGIVSPGKEYKLLKKEIVEKLQNLVDPESMEKPVARIHFRENTFPGPCMKHAPDIVVQLSYDYRFQFSPLKRTLIRKLAGSLRTGDHRREGIFISSGPGIEKGTIEREIYIEDSTSTILYLLDIPIPDIYDGKVIKELFNKSYFTHNPPKHEKTDNPLNSPSNGKNIHSQNDFEQSKELLKSLGYF